MIDGPTADQIDHWVEDRIRVTDIDFQHHVNNAVYAALFGNSRFDFLLTRVRPLVGAGDRLVVARTQTDFLREMSYGAPVRTGTLVKRVGRTSLVLWQVMYQDGAPAAASDTVMVRIDGETHAPAPWPEAVRRLVPTG